MEDFLSPPSHTCAYVCICLHVRTHTLVTPASCPYTHPRTCAGGFRYSYTCNTLYRKEKEKIYKYIQKKTKDPKYYMRSEAEH